MFKLSGLIQTFNHSTKKMDELRRVQKETNHFVPLALIQNVVTRWDSQFIMLERLLRLKEDVDECITEINSKETTASKMLPIITVDEWESIEELVHILKPMFKCTKLFQDTAHYGLPSLYPAISEMADTIRKFKPKTPVAIAVQAVIEKVIPVRFELQYAEDFWIALLLDPLKSGNYLTDEDAETLDGKMKEMLVDKAALKITARLQTSTSTQGYGGTRRNKGHLSPHKQAEAIIESQLMLYCEASRTLNENFEHSDDDDACNNLTILEILEFWRCHELSMPYLADLARRYLSVPLSSAPSERTFSTAGNIISCKRCSLAPDTMEALVFLRDNLKLLDVFGAKNENWSIDALETELKSAE